MRKPRLAMHFNTGWDRSEDCGAVAVMLGEKKRGKKVDWRMEKVSSEHSVDIIEQPKGIKL